MTRSSFVCACFSPAIVPRRFSLFAAAAFLTAGALSLHAQNPGSVDGSFKPFFNKVTVYAVAVDSQQRIVVGGDNETFERINPGGDNDNTFAYSSFGSSDNRIIYGLAIDSGDRVYAVGGFDGVTSNKKSVNIQRFAEDGSRINRGFDAGTGTDAAVVAVMLQPMDSNPDDDRIVFGGLFKHYNGSSRVKLARIVASGALDDSFDGSLTFNDDVYALAPQRDPATGAVNGQILVGGQFDQVDGSGHARLARLNFDGSLDDTFQPSVDKNVFAIDVQADGKIIIGGIFSTVNGNAANGLARLNPDGSYDPTFVANISKDQNKGKPTTSVIAIKLQADGKPLVGGSFLDVNGEGRQFLARLNPDGSVDGTFDSGSGLNNSVETIGIQSNNDIVVGEAVSKLVGSSYPKNVQRVFGDPIIPTPQVAIYGLHKAVEGGESGLFEVVRSGTDNSTPLTVYYRLTGGNDPLRPVAGVDYQTLPGSVIIPAGSGVAQIPVVPRKSVLAESPEKLTLKLQSNSSYDIVTKRAFVRIFDAKGD